ncbi:MAG: hypothetical protein ABSD71_08770 [Bacteroidales bacterium]|jgi:hypothetical protein
MAISYNNLITKNFHGRIGDIVLRWVGGRSVMSKRPDCSKVVKSPAQLANQDRFRKGVKYGQAAKRDPERYEFYRKKKKSHQSAYNAAISDFLLKPKIESIDIGGYVGVQGNMIGIKAWDKYKVESVSVLIMNRMGHVIEKGTAVARPFSEGREWNYKATMENLSYQGGKVLVWVTDLPGNVVQGVVNLDGT